ncbi:hypothetical protein KFL_001220180 [Klebsormidium nitens]|uniref:Uncharacterized protein n=1 Tax=Klebsormidium nitens TaxID=105231 RepID=A0A1Y1HZZ4_KLENI|nr:hypothetical protein KFL_001220180 [Klebsormidium nitens]|eukprot:GAQ82749.1 hypothetical protein KFL_001220180 [Klebsormidium nitens]
MAPSRRGSTSRPTGTDGTDHQFRMVTEERYKLIASAKAILKKLFLFQGLFLLMRGILTMMNQDEDGPPLPRVTSNLTLVGGVALLAGTVGLQYSSAPILRIYLVLSLASLWATIANSLESPYALKIKDALGGSKFDLDPAVNALADPAAVLDICGIFVLSLAVYTTVNLVYALRAGRKKTAQTAVKSKKGE